jgi:hypothetical protein
MKAAAVPGPVPDLVRTALANLDRAYDVKSWHGTSLKGAVRAVPVEVAVWRPALERHNVWEYTVHAAYWKYTVRRKVTGEPRGSFPLEGSNFFPRPEHPEAAEAELAAAWKADRALLDEIHRSLREAVAGMTPERLAGPAEGSKFSMLELVLGVAAHDLYHAGQIQLLKKLKKG